MIIKEEEKAKMFAKMETFIKPMNAFLECYDRVNNEVVKTKQMLSKEPFEDVTLYNAAVIGNNKVVELVQFFEKSSIPFCGNFIRTACMNYFSETLNNASLCITRYYMIINSMYGIIEEINRKPSIIRKLVLMKEKKLLLQLIEEVEKTLANYAYYTNSLFEFDLERDVNLLYDCQKRLFGNAGEDAFIEKCNSELAILGIKNRMVKTKEDALDERTYMDLINRLYMCANSIKENLKQYPNLSVALALHMNDDIEILTRAYASKDEELFKKMCVRIKSYDPSDIIKSILDLVGEVAITYGYGPVEFYDIITELNKLGLGEEASLLPENIKNDKYDDYATIQAVIFAAPVIKLGSKPTKENGSK